MAVSIFWPVWCLGNLIYTGMVDPGILVRLPPRPTPDGRPRPRYREEQLDNGKTVTVKWNDTCNFYQPPRAHHCSVNNDCIDRFDHHCPWVGTTIGRRNYRSFIGFVFGTTILCVYVMAICALQIKTKYDGLEPGTSNRVTKAMGKCAAALVVMAVCFVAFWFVGVLSAFHSYLIITNQTTYENFRDGFTMAENPYNKGCVGNCLEVFCSRQQKSRFRFRATLAEQPAPIELAEVAVVTNQKSGGAPPPPPWTPAPKAALQPATNHKPAKPAPLPSVQPTAPLAAAPGANGKPGNGAGSVGGAGASSALSSIELARGDSYSSGGGASEDGYEGESEKGTGGRKETM